MSLDLTRLKALAQAATPGPWTDGYGDGVTGPRTGASVWLDAANVEHIPVAAGGDAVAWVAKAEPGASARHQLAADAAFIAAANPAAVQELVEQLADRTNEFQNQYARLERAERALRTIAGASPNSTMRGLQQLAARALDLKSDVDNIVCCPRCYAVMDATEQLLEDPDPTAGRDDEVEIDNLEPSPREGELTIVMSMRQGDAMFSAGRHVSPEALRGFASGAIDHVRLEADRVYRQLQDHIDAIMPSDQLDDVLPLPARQVEATCPLDDAGRQWCAPLPLNLPASLDLPDAVSSTNDAPAAQHHDQT